MAELTQLENQQKILIGWYGSCDDPGCTGFNLNNQEVVDIIDSVYEITADESTPRGFHSAIYDINGGYSSEHDSKQRLLGLNCGHSYYIALKKGSPGELKTLSIPEFNFSKTDTEDVRLLGSTDGTCVSRMQLPCSNTEMCSILEIEYQSGDSTAKVNVPLIGFDENGFALYGLNDQTDDIFVKVFRIRNSWIIAKTDYISSVDFFSELPDVHHFTYDWDRGTLDTTCNPKDATWGSDPTQEFISESEYPLNTPNAETYYYTNPTLGFSGEHNRLSVVAVKCGTTFGDGGGGGGECPECPECPPCVTDATIAFSVNPTIRNQDSFPLGFTFSVDTSKFSK